MSQQGGDNHFVSARERDLRPLVGEGVEQLELSGRPAAAFEALLEEAWLSGTRNGHAKLMNHALRAQKDPTVEPRLEPGHMEAVEAEFKAMMEASADVLNLPFGRTLTLWDLLSRAWIAGVQTYESEVMASLIERRSDVAEEARRWLEEDGGS